MRALVLTLFVVSIPTTFAKINTKELISEALDTFGIIKHDSIEI